MKKVYAKSFCAILTLNNELYILGKMGSLAHHTPTRLSECVTEVHLGE